MKWLKGAIAAASLALLATEIPALAQSVSGGITLLLGGNTGGYNNNFTVTPVVSGSAYTANYALSAFIQLSVFRTTTQPSGTLNYISVASKGGETAGIEVWAFNASSTTLTSTCTKNAAFVLTSADLSYLVPGFPILLTPAATNGATQTIAAADPVVSVKNSDSVATQNMTFCLVTTGTPTLTSVGDIVLGGGILQD